jgi:hypothetical protein
MVILRRLTISEGGEGRIQTQHKILLLPLLPLYIYPYQGPILARKAYCRFPEDYYYHPPGVLRKAVVWRLRHQPQPTLAPGSRVHEADTLLSFYRVDAVHRLLLLPNVGGPKASSDIMCKP